MNRASPKPPGKGCSGHPSSSTTSWTWRREASAARAARHSPIGLLLPSVANPFSSEIHRAMEDSLAARGIAVFAASLDDDPEREKSLVAAFLGRRVDGLVLTPIARSQAYAIPEHSRDLPMVFIDREPVGIEADAVVTDNAVGAARAAAHLMAHGHTKLAYLGDRPDIQTARERRRGFIEELGRAGQCDGRRAGPGGTARRGVSPAGCPGDPHGREPAHGHLLQPEPHHVRCHASTEGAWCQPPGGTGGL